MLYKIIYVYQFSFTCNPLFSTLLLVFDFFTVLLLMEVYILQNFVSFLIYYIIYMETICFKKYELFQACHHYSCADTKQLKGHNSEITSEHVPTELYTMGSVDREVE